MVIVAGHVTVDPEQRESYLAGSMSVVGKARQVKEKQMVKIGRPVQVTSPRLATA